MTFAIEIKRKAFHHLALGYLAVYLIGGRSVGLAVLSALMVLTLAAEFLRLRRPELNAWCLVRFGGIHRESEIMKISGIFWTMLGVWLTMLVFTHWRIVSSAIGFLVFGDTAAALAGKRWGRHPLPWNSRKTWEGVAAFALVSALWATLILRHPIAALLAAGVSALLETRELPWNDNFWIPILGGASLSVFNLILGK